MLSPPPAPFLCHSAARLWAQVSGEGFGSSALSLTSPGPVRQQIRSRWSCVPAADFWARVFCHSLNLGWKEKQSICHQGPKALEWIAWGNIGWDSADNILFSEGILLYLRWSQAIIGLSSLLSLLLFVIFALLYFSLYFNDLFSYVLHFILCVEKCSINKAIIIIGDVTEVHIPLYAQYNFIDLIFLFKISYCMWLAAKP